MAVSINQSESSIDALAATFEHQIVGLSLF